MADVMPVSGSAFIPDQSHNLLITLSLKPSGDVTKKFTIKLIPIVDCLVKETAAY